jgi:3-deoxy-D-manno-octulosonic-acid transferase
MQTAEGEPESRVEPNSAERLRHSPDLGDELFAAASRRMNAPAAQRWSRLAYPAFAYLLYFLFHVLVSPFLAIRSLQRARKRGHKGIIWTRLTGGTKPPYKARWTVIIAGGLGEKRAGFAVAERLIAERDPHVAVSVQSQNAVGIKHVSIHSGILPFNNPISVLLFLWRWRPRNLIAVEFWDNHHLAAWSAFLGIRTVIFNVPITEAATRQITPQARWRYRLIGTYCVQGKAHLKRMLTAGIDRDAVVLTGPIGIAVDPVQGLAMTPAETRDFYREKLKLHADHFPVIVAGSTYRADEEAVLEAFDSVRRVYPKAVLILAPRGVNRPGGCDSTLVEQEREFARYSRGIDAMPDSGVLLIDQVGELKYLYSVGHMAFVGGTMGQQGSGHTPVEANAWYLPITIGPDFPQQKLIIDMLQKEGIAIICQTSDELATAWLDLAADEARRIVIAQETKHLFSGQDEMIVRLYDNLCLPPDNAVRQKHA